MSCAPTLQSLTLPNFLRKYSSLDKFHPNKALDTIAVSVYIGRVKIPYNYNNRQ